MSQLGLFGETPPTREPEPQTAPARPHLDRDELARRILACEPNTSEYEWLLSQLATKDVPRPPKDSP